MIPCQLIKRNKYYIYIYIFFFFQKLKIHRSKTESHNRDSRRMKIDAISVHQFHDHSRSLISWLHFNFCFFSDSLLLGGA